MLLCIVVFIASTIIRVEILWGQRIRNNKRLMKTDGKWRRTSFEVFVSCRLKIVPFSTGITDGHRANEYEFALYVKLSDRPSIGLGPVYRLKVAD